MHSHSHHSHEHASAGASSRIAWAFFLNAGFSVIEFIGGMLTNSTAIMADAVHDLGDSLAIGLAWGLAKFSDSPSSDSFSYGYRRFSLLGALINGVILLLGSLWVLNHAIPRLQNPVMPETTGMLVLALFGVVVNGLAAYKLGQGSTQNERMLNWHLLEDVLGWAAVLVGAAVMHFTAWAFVDPLLSIGISIFPGDGDDSCELIRNADTAMYEAKKTGRYTVKAYSADQTDQVRQRAKMENALRRALSHGAIDVAYQPQFRHGGRSLVGIEALARWHDPQLGEVPPSQFIPLAESIGLIVPLGEFILRRVCTQMVAWRQQGVEPPRVAVNVSGHQLRRANFVSMLREILAETGCRAEQLEIEVTESDMLDRAQDSIATLAEIRALGVAVSMDDFGTGYSSLSYLKKLPIQTIKIDRSFIDGLPGDDNDRAIVDAIVALGRSLSLRVLAEGVETEAQAGFLGAHGCIEMQGYLYGRPTTPDAIARLLATAVG